jgi:hypothetical protein
MASFVGHPPDDDPPPLPPAVAPSSCVCRREEGSGGTKKLHRIKKPCHPTEDGGPKICLDELNPFANDSHVALSIVTLPNQRWLDENTEIDGDPSDIEEKTEQYRLKSISDIEAEIKRHLEFYSMNLAPKMEGIIVITDDPPIWITDPFIIPPDPDLRSKIKEVIFVMEKCKDHIFSKHDLYDILSLIEEVAKKKYLYYDFTRDNLCKSQTLKLIDFDDKYIAGPDIVNIVNNIYDPVTSEKLMIYSMWLIFIMSVYNEYQNDLMSNPNTKYPLLLSGYTPRKILTNVRAIIEYLLLYESSPKEISPFGQLIHYTSGLEYRITTYPNMRKRIRWPEQQILDTMTEDEKEVVREKNKEDREAMLEEIIEQILENLENIASIYRMHNGGSKRKTRRRIKKRGKKGETRRR